MGSDAPTFYRTVRAADVHIVPGDVPWLSIDPDTILVGRVSAKAGWIVWVREDGDAGYVRREDLEALGSKRNEAATGTASERRWGD